MAEKKKRKKKKRDPGEPSGVPGRRAGQVASEKARFDLGPDARVIGDALGTPPPGYGLTIVRAFVRDPRTLVAVWELDDPDLRTRGEEAGFGDLVLRVVDETGSELARVPIGERSGVYHVDVGSPGAIAVVEVGFTRPGGGFSAAARSAALRFPPDPSFRADSAEDFVRVDPDADLRRLAAMERPPGPGHAERRASASSARRLAERLQLAERACRAERDRSAAQSSPPAAAGAPAREEPDEAEDDHEPAGGEAESAGATPPDESPGAAPEAGRRSPVADADAGDARDRPVRKTSPASHGSTRRPVPLPGGERPTRPRHENGRSGRGRH